MRFDLTDLRLFLHVAEAGSITHGAMRANLALPSASERLRGMEDACGVRLLDRGRRGVALTAAGDALAHHARLILRQIEQMQGDLGDYAGGLKGNVRLLANTAAITEFLPEVLAPYIARRPHINIDLKERLSTEIVKAVSSGLAEIGIISDAVDAAGLQLLPFAIDRLVLVAPPDHPLAEAKRVAFAEIVRQAFVGLTEGSPLQDHIDDHAARVGHPLKLRIRVRTFDDVCRIVACNAGIGIVPETAAKRCRRSLPIRSVRLIDDWATRHLSLCVGGMQELSPFARDLAHHLSAGVKAARS